MAKKIREEVAQEKERQLKNLEKVKNQELDCWRQNVLAQKNHDYTNAVFQIGAAHRAAQEENQENEAKKMQRTKAQAEKFRQQIRARRSCQNQLLNGRDRGQCLEFGQQSKTPLKDKCTERSLPVKRKKCANVCFKKLNEYCAAISSNSSESESDYDSSSTLQDSSFLDNCDCEEKATQTSAKISAKLQQTPAVILDVEVSSSDEVIITNPREMTDTHATNNRQFSAVNRNQQTETASHDDGNDGNDQQIESNPSSRYVNSTESQPASQNCNIDINQNLTKKTIKLPKFTQVSDLLNRKHQEENAENSQRRINLKSPQKSKSPAKKSVSPTKIAVIPCSPAKTTTKSTTRPLPKSYNPPPSVPKSPMKKNCTKSPQKSVNKQNKKPAKSLPTKTTSSPKKAAHSKNIPKPLSRTSDISKQTKELMSKEKAYHPPPPSGASSSQSAATVTLFPGGSQGKSSISARSYTTQFNGQNVKVQYYDYKNKFSKSYDQPNNIQREIPVSAPMGEIDNNARQQAEVEKELNVKHNEQIEQLR